MKKWFVGGLWMLLVFGIIQVVTPLVRAAVGPNLSNTSRADAGYLSQAFKATGAVENGYLVHNWSQLTASYMTNPQLAKIGQTIERTLQMQSPHVLQQQQPYQSYYEVSGQWPDGSTVAFTLSSFEPKGAAASTILVIRVQNDTGNVTQFASALGRVQNAVTNSGGTPQISACLQGFIDARLMNVSGNKVIQNAFSAVTAHRIEGVAANDMMSISGYSSQGPSYILTNGHRMNLQVAIHDDEFHHRTNVIVGTPIITETY